ncbi:MAG: GH3 auxin-responsive promoter family protein [Cyclobacteriaceae bacterium]|nr:GH3 auxin-responsive promoter family protein [Cyclobacteriaceae bacterium]MCH8514999.1 GH3 auxin-responsive promoter family protein [Cyclobacteriaceae bacterium]
MGIRSFLSKPLAAWVVKRQNEWAAAPGESQAKVFETLISKAKHTAFGKDHGFGDIQSYDDFKKQVPIRDYEELSPYVKRVVAGEADILWPGLPIYFSKTSGTTSGAKYIPITKDSIHNHIDSARNALLSYINETGKGEFLDGKLIFLSGSPELDLKGKVPTGRLSGIVNHHVPGYLRTNQKPSYETNCIDDWERKLEKVIDETIDQNMTLISGIPPWVQMYFDRIQERTSKKIKDVFPNFNLYVYGGVNFEPYKKKLFESIGHQIDSIETYPASEGFMAYQTSQEDPGLLALLDSGIFFEFIPADQYFEENPPRYSITEVELNKNYAVILNNNAGLWGYTIGDTVKFISKDPYKLLVTGRIKHFISAFGEHVIGEEVEKAMQYATSKHPEVEIVEFSVAPQVTPNEGLPLHEWYVEFAHEPNDWKAFEKDLDLRLQELNSYYYDLVSGSILRPLKVIPLQQSAFRNYMKKIGKLGGQNKVPRLANDRKIADAVQEFIK